MVNFFNRVILFPSTGVKSQDSSTSINLWFLGLMDTLISPSNLSSCLTESESSKKKRVCPQCVGSEAGPVFRRKGFGASKSTSNHAAKPWQGANIVDMKEKFERQVRRSSFVTIAQSKCLMTAGCNDMSFSTERLSTWTSPNED